MKKILALLSVISFISLTGCVKEAAKTCPYQDSAASATAAERTYLQDYFLLNSISAEADPSGVFYSITRNGSGNRANVCSQVFVKYSGYLLGNGTAFDANNTTGGIPFNLGALIVGWQKGLPLIQKDGIITLYIPPSLGYGSNDVRDGNGNVVIPGNSYLKFDIELVNVL